MPPVVAHRMSCKKKKSEKHYVNNIHSFIECSA